MSMAGQPDFASIYGGDDILAPRLAAHREDPQSEVANLHPRDWFEPFADVTDA